MFIFEWKMFLAKYSCDNDSQQINRKWSLKNGK